VYNLLDGAGVGDEYDIRTVVYDAVGNQYFERDNTKNRRHESSVEVGTVNTSSFQSGTYTLMVAVVDKISNLAVTSSRRFFVFNPHHGIAEDARDSARHGVVASIFAIMSEEELDQEFERMRYITASDDRQVYSRLESKAEKQVFLYEYWRKLDPDPITSVNPLRQEYLNRVEHANQQFSFGFREGWRSDRGRVFITYGPPDEYERYPSRSDTKPFEIWHYNNIQGGVVFVFVDRTGFQDYQLVHSTHRSELRDDNWQQYIRQN
jgi:GWxTD domain-containing protein